MVPLWAAIVVGFLSGTLGTLLTIGHQRGAEIRTRMVEAADDYLQAVFELINGIRNLRLALEASVRPPQEEIDEIRARLQEVEDRLTPVRGRIQLLFGASPTLWAVLEVSECLERVRRAFEAWQLNEPGSQARANQEVGALGEAVAAFSEGARRHLRYGVFSRFFS